VNPTYPGRCLICRHVGRRKQVGALTVLDCVDCGHGWLERLVADNDHFESDYYSEWRSTNRSVMRERARKYVRELTAVTGSLPASAAEIGCSTGETVGLIAERGGECWAVDMARSAIDMARFSFPAVHFEVDVFPRPDRPVEAVLMMHVLEHLADPLDYLVEARKIVMDNGLLYLRLPNYGSLVRRVSGACWPDYMADHVHYFTKRSLRHTVTKAGWEVIHLSTAGQAWAWLGAAKRIVTRRRPTAVPTAAAPPSERQMRLLGLAERLGKPALLAEGRLALGNELILVARAVD
jgi:2-polyprenyl-3-methyl-5-hydroxy-6-metoxy-1,4-benzoquinol methylase